ncbi:phosphopyruvate hydratase [Candidatus Nomurabacteria bacterium]|nr:phosphopyruvate hydratase [Candidatus Nomurabacteria bacterium]
MSQKITSVAARQILDSRGNPTVEADVYLADGSMGRASVPSGASTGSREAIELRDGDSAYGGKGVLKAINNIKDKIAPAITGLEAGNQKLIDDTMREIDGTNNKSNLGANAILAVSLAAAKASANSEKLPLYEYIGKIADTSADMCLPLPMMNVMNGGQHAAGSTDIQEFMIIPKGAKSFADALETGVNIFHSLKNVLSEKGYSTTVGDEGGYAPRVKNGNSEPLDLIAQSTVAAGYSLGSDVCFALDVAASEFATSDGYFLKTEGKSLSSSEIIEWYKALKDRFPIVSIEDGLDEDDWGNWKKLTEQLGSQTQLVGDDLLVTNVALLEKAIDEQAGNAILIKPNQIGSLSETIDAVKLAKKAGWNTIMSHRSGETEDTTIAHLAVGLGTGQIKTGSLSRTDRVLKYNELLRISEMNPELKLAEPL